MNTSITIKNVDESINNWIIEQARKRGLSAETIILETIRKEIRAENKPVSLPTYHDLDSLAGTWDEKQAQEFFATTNDFGKVEQELWK